MPSAGLLGLQLLMMSTVIKIIHRKKNNRKKNDQSYIDYGILQ